jgi:hypothetical protein
MILVRSEHAMKRRLLWLIGMAAVGLLADERADRDAVQRTISSLNERNWRAATITSDPAALREFEKLLAGKDLVYRIRPGVGRPVTVNSQHGMFGRPAVKVSAPAVELQNPRVVTGGVVFEAEDVAVAQASLVEWSGTDRRSTPLRFVVRREAGIWKIAELRVGVE